MNTKIKHIILFVLAFNYANSQTTIKLSQLEKAAGTGSTVVTNSVGTLYYVPNPTLTVSGQSLSISRGNTVTIPSQVSQTVVSTETLTAPSEYAVYNFLSNQSSTIIPIPANVVNTTTVPATVITLTLQANTKYVLRGMLRIGCSSTGGVKFGNSYTGTIAAYTMMQGMTSGVTASGYVYYNHGSTSASPALCTQNNSGGGAMFYTIIRTFTDCTYTFLMSAGASSQTATIYSADSFLELVKY